MDDATHKLIVTVIFILFWICTGGLLLLLAVAALAKQVGRKRLSLKLYSILAKIAHRDILPHLGLARALVQNSKLEEAIPEYTRLLQLNPLHKDAYFELADVYEKLGRPDEALRTYQAFLTILGPYRSEVAQEAIQESQAQISRLQQVIGQHTA